MALAAMRESLARARARSDGRWVRSLAAAALLGLSLLMPYWRVTLYAPQYPGGLRADIYLTRVGGDAREIDILNHYIGMKSLSLAAPLERRLAVPLVLGGVLAVGSAPLFGRLGLLLQAPAVVFPVGVVADLAYWLWRFGHSLDPSAPIRVEPFMPPVIGRGTVMQFTTVAAPRWGFLLAVATAALALYNVVTGWRR
ncbi:MAG: cytochrome C [Armatimonadota bacterium]|nr:cytochrome C [Armatimonadota bacterium]MDR7402162.1 cytochrome C [Armatimonadota bacterium]MDR7404669.1 cytochrome C [Armatimonadota bacterium]MDR7436919.1 cytochrome C [Armatimonadota bacterium]MDR7472307.1 cytochrome C [Armatimonadota bacterium]